MSLNEIYHDEIPKFLKEFSSVREMNRIRNVGMNCGCEYTSFDIFKNIGSYSRYQHSLGCAVMAYHFTADIRQSIAALYHDIATPVFAHVIDFLNGDYEKQESTEKETERIISSSREIGSLLKKYGLKVSDICDYHKYPICDNDSPQLSCDRLEYTLGHLVLFGFRDLTAIREYYDNIVVAKNEKNEPELAFRDEKLAREFALDTLKCSRIYVSDEDRYSMQILAEILKLAIDYRVISEEDLYTEEPQVIEKLKSRKLTNALWSKFCDMKMMYHPEPGDSNARVISAKKRYIDPLVVGKGRVSQLSENYVLERDRFLNLDFNIRIAGM